jgi:polyhydroxybutyrate depolymerase
MTEISSAAKYRMAGMLRFPCSIAPVRPMSAAHDRTLTAMPPPEPALAPAGLPPQPPYRRQRLTARLVLRFSAAVIGLWAFAAAATLALPGEADPGLRIALEVGGAVRSYILHAPPPGSIGPRPLLIALHGWLGTGAGLARMTNLSEAADRRGVAVAYPDGKWWAWGVGPSDPGWSRDSSFLQAVVRDASARLQIDPARVYAVGFSNGGFMAQALACLGELKLAGVAVVSSNLFETAASACHQPAAVPYLLIHGTSDPVVPFGGGSTWKGEMLSIPDTMRFWATANGCDGRFARKAVASADPGVTVIRDEATGCRKGGAAEAWLLQGGGHDWPGRDTGFPSFLVGRASEAVDATTLVLDFLLDRHQVAGKPER